MYEKLLKHKNEYKKTINLDVNLFNDFVFEADESFLIGNNSIFSSLYTSFVTALKTNNASAVLKIMQAASYGSCTLVNTNPIPNPDVYQIISEGYLYFLARGKAVLLNGPDENPYFVPELIKYNNAESVFFDGHNLSVKLIRMNRNFQCLDEKKCVANNLEFIKEYLSIFSINFQKSDLNPYINLITSTYCGLFSAHQLLNNCHYVFLNVKTDNVVQPYVFKGLLRCLSIPINEYFTFPDGFKKCDYHDSLKKCINLYVDYIKYGIQNSLLPYEFCLRLTNPIIKKINHLIELNLDEENVKSCKDFKDKLLEWSL